MTPRQWLGFHRGFLTLVALAGAAAAIFVWGSRGYQERDVLAQWIDIQCAAAGEPYRPARPRLKPGQACATQISALAAFRAETDQASVRILSAASAERDAKTATATLQAQRAADSARRAAQMMETANAAVKDDDRVGPGWFDALNQSAGLRRPGD